MTQIEKAKQHYDNKEYPKAIDLILNLINKGIVLDNSIEYHDILLYLGDSRLCLYHTSRNKSLVYEALTDFATGANSLFAFHQTISTDLNNRIKKCIGLLFKPAQFI